MSLDDAFPVSRLELSPANFTNGFTPSTIPPNTHTQQIHITNNNKRKRHQRDGNEQGYTGDDTDDDDGAPISSHRGKSLFHHPSSSCAPSTLFLPTPSVSTSGLSLILSPPRPFASLPSTSCATPYVEDDAAMQPLHRHHLKRGYSLFAASDEIESDETAVKRAASQERTFTRPRTFMQHSAASLDDIPPLASMDCASTSSPSTSSSSPVGGSRVEPFIPSTTSAMAQPFCPDPRAFEDAHSFKQKTLTHPSLPPLAAHLYFNSTSQPQHGVSLFPSLASSTSSLGFSAAASSSLGVLSSTSSTSLLLPTQSRKRLQLKCPPTPVPKMCIAVGGQDLFSNKILLPTVGGNEFDISDEWSDFSRHKSASRMSGLSDSELDDDFDPTQPVIDIHASSAFTNSPTYSSANPFAHTDVIHPEAHANLRKPYIFQLNFRDHKLVGSGGFFEVFRCEKRQAPLTMATTGLTSSIPLSNGASSSSTFDLIHDRSHVREQQHEFKRFSETLTEHLQNDQASTGTSSSLSSSRRSSLHSALLTSSSVPKVYAIKKSLKSFRSEYDRDCYLRESRMLDFINRTRVKKPNTDLMSHRNPHIVRSHCSWQENGFFFERLEYCLCNLNELVYMMMETPADNIVAKPVAAPSSSSSLFGPSTNNSIDSSPNADLRRPSLTIQTDAPPLATSEQTSAVPLFESYFQRHLLPLFLSIAVQISLGLHQLHKHDIVHLDVKPDNVLLNGRASRLLLSDFGFAKSLDEIHGGRGSPLAGGVLRRRESEEGIEGDSIYMAPELLNTPMFSDNEEQKSFDTTIMPISTKADMFSLGLLLFEFISNCELPHSGYLWQRLRSGHVSDYLPSGSGQPGIEFMCQTITRLLEPSPRSRMSADELLQACAKQMKEMERARDGDTNAADVPIPSTDELVYEWTRRLPKILALPPLHTLNYQSLLIRANDQFADCGTPIPTPRASPNPAWPGAQRTKCRASPMLRRQYSSPAPGSTQATSTTTLAHSSIALENIASEFPRSSPPPLMSWLSSGSSAVATTRFAPSWRPATSIHPTAQTPTPASAYAFTVSSASSSNTSRMPPFSATSHYRSISLGVLGDSSSTNDILSPPPASSTARSSNVSASTSSPKRSITPRECAPVLLPTSRPLAYSRSSSNLITLGSPPSPSSSPPAVSPTRVRAHPKPIILPSPSLPRGNIPLSPFKLSSPAKKSWETSPPSTTNGSILTSMAKSIMHASPTIGSQSSASSTSPPMISSTSSPPIGSLPPYRALFNASTNLSHTPTRVTASSVLGGLHSSPSSSLPPFSPAHLTPPSSMTSASSVSMFAPSATRLFANSTSHQPPAPSSLVQSKGSTLFNLLTSRLNTDD